MFAARGDTVEDVARRTEPSDEIVISGIAGVFPKCDNVLEFGEKLLAKEDLISETDHYYAGGKPNIRRKIINLQLSREYTSLGIRRPRTSGLRAASCWRANRSEKKYLRDGRENSIYSCVCSGIYYDSVCGCKLLAHTESYTIPLQTQLTEFPLPDYISILLLSILTVLLYLTLFPPRSFAFFCRRRRAAVQIREIRMRFEEIRRGIFQNYG